MTQRERAKARGIKARRLAWSVSRRRGPFDERTIEAMAEAFEKQLKVEDMLRAAIGYWQELYQKHKRSA